MRDCEEWERFRAEYDRLNDKYLAAVDDTTAAYGVLVKEFLRLMILNTHG